MADRYITINEAAELKGVAPATIHEALCSGNLPTIILYRSGRDEHRLVGRWELEQWAPGTDADGGGTFPRRREPRITVLCGSERTPLHRAPVLS